MMREIDGKNSLHFHLDPKILETISEGKYIDFAKLLRDDSDDNEGMQVVKQNGLEFFIPATKPPSKIGDYVTWDKAFLVFQSAYQVYFPERAGELLEYCESIDRLAGVFDWGKVYSYDKHFRRVMAANPQRPWGLVNQDAKDKYLLKAGTSEKVQKTPALGGWGTKGTSPKSAGSFVGGGTQKTLVSSKKSVTSTIVVPSVANLDTGLLLARAGKTLKRTTTRRSSHGNQLQPQQNIYSSTE